MSQLTVRELIAELEKVEDKDSQVRVHIDFDDTSDPYENYWVDNVEFCELTCHGNNHIPDKEGTGKNCWCQEKEHLERNPNSKHINDPDDDWSCTEVVISGCN